MNHEISAIEQRLKQSAERLSTLAKSPGFAQGDLRESIRQITEAACDALRASRSSIWFYDSSHTSIRCHDLFVASEASHDAGTELFAKDFPAYFEALRSERTIAAVDAHTDARTQEFSAPYLAPLGIGAMLDAPIRVGGRMIGVICNEQVGGPRSWTWDEEFVAAALADHAAIAVLTDERRNAETQLKLLVQELEQTR